MKIVIFLATVSAANIFVSVDGYETPTPLVELISPRGFRVSIPDAPGVELFAFHGNINREIEGVEAGDMNADVHRQQGGRWTYKNPRADLNPGDTLYFWTMVHADGRGYQKLYQTYTVPAGAHRVRGDTIRPRQNRW